jgi:hypothetical protein
MVRNGSALALGGDHLASASGHNPRRGMGGRVELVRALEGRVWKQVARLGE